MSKLLAIITMCLLGACLSKAEFNKKEAIQKYMSVAEACVAEAGAIAADIDDMINEKPAGSMEAKCMRACLMKKFDVMDASGKFVKSVAIEHAKMWTSNDADKMKIINELIDACEHIEVSSDHCEAAEEYGKCYKEQALARGIEKINF